MDKELQVAVDWWKQVLRDQPRRDAGAGADQAMQFAELMGTTLGLRFTPTSDQVELFGCELLAQLLDSLTQWGGHLVVGCDYHPDRELAEAAKVAGIKELAFPWKTNMWIEPGSVKVSHGYGAGTETLYP